MASAKECPCIDSKPTFKHVINCVTQGGSRGFLTLPENICYPLNYGSNICKKHDDGIDPKCKGIITDQEDSSPNYCEQSWCYIDVETCMMSQYDIFPSSYFRDFGLFYSYATCNSTNTFLSEDLLKAPLEDLSKLSVTVPESFYPFNYKYKSDGSGEIADSSSPEYYNNSVPWKGAVIDYVTQILNDAGVDAIEFKYRSKPSDNHHPSSKFTASIRDVNLGLTDMGAGTYWVTPERLQMAAFTATIAFDEAMLVVPKPSFDNSFWPQAKKLFEPFDPALWMFLIFIVFFVAAISLWFANSKLHDGTEYAAFRNEEWKNASFCRRFNILCRQYGESLIEKWVFLFSASVALESHSTLSLKLITMGFAFLILVVIASYTANLVVYLAKSDLEDYIDSMERVIEDSKILCAHATLQDDLEKRWPKVKFRYSEGEGVVANYLDLFNKFGDGTCDALVVSKIETFYHSVVSKEFCKHDLVFTNVLVLTTPMAFPIRDDLAASVSYWMMRKEKESDITFESILESYKPELNCTIFISDDGHRQEGLQQMGLSQFLFPITVFGVLTGIAIILKLCNSQNGTKTKRVLSHVMNDTHSQQIMKIINNCNFDVFAEHEDGLLSQDQTNNEESEGANKLHHRRQKIKKELMRAASMHALHRSDVTSEIEYSSNSTSCMKEMHQDAVFQSMEDVVQKAVFQSMEDAVQKIISKEQFFGIDKKLAMKEN